MALALMAGACWAGYIVAGGQVSHVVPSGTGVATGMIVATLTVLPAVVVSGAWLRQTPTLLGTGAPLAVLSSAIPLTLELVALQTLPARTFSVLLSLEPEVAAVCGWLLLHETLSVNQWVAVLLVMVASIGGAWTTRQQRVSAGENANVAAPSPAEMQARRSSQSR